MKYNIYINQRAIIELNKSLQYKLDLKDATLLDWLINFSKEKRSIKKVIKNKEYFWGSYGIMITQNPLLNIKDKETISKRIKKIQIAGLIEKYLDRDDGNKTYFNITPKCYNLLESRNLPAQKSKPTRSKGDTLPAQKSNNNNIINNNINNSFSEKKINSFYELFKKEFTRISAKANKKYNYTPKIKKQFITLLENEFTPENIINAIENAYNQPYWRDQNYNALTPVYLLTDENINKFMNTTIKNKSISHPTLKRIIS